MCLTTRRNPNTAGRLQAFADTHRILVCIDYGTGRVSVCFAICKNDSVVIDDDLTDLRFHDAGHEPPNILAIHNNELFWGFNVEKAIADFQFDEVQVIDQLKLELYEDHGEATEPRRKATREQLRELGLTADELFAMHLAALKRDILAEIYKSDTRFVVPERELRELSVRFRISVPQMWSFKALDRMQAAAKVAGMELVVLASEPENALGYLVHMIAKKYIRLSRPINADEYILVVDLGCGTGDFVTFRLQGELTLTSRFDAISSTSGGLLGSHRVDEILLKKVEEGGFVQRAGGLQAIKARLGFSDIKWRKAMLRVITDAKCKFPLQPYYTCAISGTDPLELFSFNLTHAEIQSAFDEVLHDIKQQIDIEIHKNKPKAIYVTGGFGRNPYLMDQLRQEYETQDTMVLRPSDAAGGESYPVSRGGLLRNDKISAQDLPSEYCYAVVQHELYSWRLHPDAVAHIGRQVRRFTVGKYANGRPIYDHRMVDVHFKDDNVAKESPHDRTKIVVEDRLFVFFEKGSQLSAGRVRSQDFYQEYYLPVNNPKLSATLVFSLEDLKTHGPSDRVGDSDVFRRGIEHLKTVTKRIDPDFLKLHKVPTNTNEDGEEEYKVLCRVVVKYSGGHEMTIGWEMLIENERARWAIEGRYGSVPLWENDEQVWSANFSFFKETPRVEADVIAEAEGTGDAEETAGAEETGEAEETEEEEEIGDAMEVDAGGNLITGLEDGEDEEDEEIAGGEEIEEDDDDDKRKDTPMSDS